MGSPQPKASNLRRAPRAPSRLRFPTATNARDQRGRIIYLQQRSENEATDLISAPLWSQIAPLPLQIFSRPTSVDMLLPLLTSAILLSPWPRSPRPPLFLNHPELIPGSGIPYLSLFFWICPWLTHSYIQVLAQLASCFCAILFYFIYSTYHYLIIICDSFSLCCLSSPLECKLQESRDLLCQSLPWPPPPLSTEKPLDTHLWAKGTNAQE